MPAASSAISKLGREVQSRGRRRHGTRPRREHRLVVLAIARIRVGTADIGRQRRRPVRLQLLDHPVASAAEVEQHRAVLALVRDLGGEVRGEVDAVAGPQSAGGADERPPASRLRLDRSASPRWEPSPRRPKRRAGSTSVSLTTSKSPGRSRRGRSRTVRSSGLSPKYSSLAASRGRTGCCAIAPAGKREIEFADPHRAAEPTRTRSVPQSPA